jgi:hypothetical protein
MALGPKISPVLVITLETQVFYSPTIYQHLAKY